MIMWWRELSRRERLLIGLVGSLVIVLALFLLLVRPLSNFRDDAVQNLAAAQNTSRLVNQAIAAGAINSGQVQSADNLRGVITNTAQRYGLRWINIRTNQEELSLTISFSGAKTSDLFPWLIDLQEKNRIIVRDARISDSRNSEDRVEASITFVQGG